MRKAPKIVVNRRAVLGRASRVVAAQGRKLLAVRSGPNKSVRFIVLGPGGRIEREYAGGLAEIAKDLGILRPWEALS